MHAMSGRPRLTLPCVVLCAASLASCAGKPAPVVTPRDAERPPAPNVVGLAPVGRGPLAVELDPLFGTPSLSTAVWSVLVQSLDSGEVLYRLNPDTLVMPASNQKILTTAVAASRLGWDFRFETRLETAAPVADGVLRGDLFVVGNGDPTINARERRRDTVFDEMAAALKAAGITRIEGRLVGDDNAFDDEQYGSGWQWDDFAFGYSAPVGPLQFNENVVEVAIAAGSAEGQPAAVTLRPEGSDLVAVNRVATAASTARADVDIWRFPGRRELIVSGSVPAGGQEVVRSAAVDNPTRYFVGAMKAALASRGITTGEAVDIDDVPAVPPAGERRVLARFTSPPLSESAKTLMKISQNLYAETAMRAISLTPGPATMEASRKLAEQTLSRWGVPPGSYVIADGSGLSRMNFVSASMIMAILRAMARDARQFDAFVATLPVAGQDGTIAGRMKGTRAEGNVKAKTGTIANVRSLSGYLTTTAGERVAFSMIANNFTAPSATVDAAVEAALERVIAGAPAARAVTASGSAPPSPSASVEAVVRRYFAARTGLDVAAVQQVYPGLLAERERATMRSIREACQEFSERATAVSIISSTADEALARAVVEATCRQRVGRPLRQTHQVEVDLTVRKDASGDWGIVKVERATRP
jgi:D-alanyl-D-alanine carboxypeptidase/D-alanyl-D-alanine-endopeptidase (penicillin-binding protein 4)